MSSPSLFPWLTLYRINALRTLTNDFTVVRPETLERALLLGEDVEQFKKLVLKQIDQVQEEHKKEKDRISNEYQILRAEFGRDGDVAAELRQVKEQLKSLKLIAMGAGSSLEEGSSSRKASRTSYMDSPRTPGDDTDGSASGKLDLSRFCYPSSHF